MHILLGDFARNVNVNALCNRLPKQALRAARTPGQAIDGLARIADQQGFALQSRRNASYQFRQRAWFCGTSIPTQILLAKAPFDRPSQMFGQLSVVAKFTMTVERQMIANQVDVMLEKRLQAY